MKTWLTHSLLTIQIPFFLFVIATNAFYLDWQVKNYAENRISSLQRFVDALSIGVADLVVSNRPNEINQLMTNISSVKSIVSYDIQDDKGNVLASKNFAQPKISGFLTRISFSILGDRVLNASTPIFQNTDDVVKFVDEIIFFIPFTLTLYAHSLFDSHLSTFVAAAQLMT